MAQSRMYAHCLRVYEAMVKDAYVDSDLLIYRGFLSNLFKHDLNLPLPYYTVVKRTLEELGCIEQLKRGGGRGPSEWQLNYPPDELLFEQSKQFGMERRRTTRETLEQSLLSLNNRLQEAERQIAELSKEVYGADRQLGRGEQVSKVR